VPPYSARVVGTFGITCVIRSLPYKVTATDPLSFAGLTLFLVGIAALALLSKNLAFARHWVKETKQ
jgi:hypothetical protein